MITLICRYCGKEFDVMPCQAKQKCCSVHCAQSYRREEEAAMYDHSLIWERDKGDKRLWVCPYNQNVTCYARRCINCGWKPEVAARRSEEIRKRLEEEYEILRESE